MVERGRYVNAVFLSLSACWIILFVITTVASIFDNVDKQMMRHVCHELCEEDRGKRRVQKTLMCVNDDVMVKAACLVDDEHVVVRRAPVTRNANNEIFTETVVVS